MHFNYSEKRKFRRITVQLYARVFIGEAEYAAKVGDISLGGAFINTALPVSVGGEVSVQFLGNFPLEIAEEFKGKIYATVRWVRGSSVAGFGIQFNRRDGDGQK